jgi:large subunit ribosomal protein L35
MPKMKTHRGAAKRFRVTKNGKIKHKKVGHGHLLSSKTQKRKRKLRKIGILDASFTKKVSRMLGL